MKCTYCKRTNRVVYPVIVKVCYGDPCYGGKVEHICWSCYNDVADTDKFFYGLKVVLFDRKIKPNHQTFKLKTT